MPLTSPHCAANAYEEWFKCIHTYTCVYVVVCVCVYTLNVIQVLRMRCGGAERVSALRSRLVRRHSEEAEGVQRAARSGGGTKGAGGLGWGLWNSRLAVGQQGMGGGGIVKEVENRAWEMLRLTLTQTCMKI